MLTKTCLCGCERTFKVYPSQVDTRKYFSKECYAKAKHKTHCKCGVELKVENTYKTGNYRDCLCKECRGKLSMKYTRPKLDKTNGVVCGYDGQSRKNVSDWIEYYMSRPVAFELDWKMEATRENVKEMAIEVCG